MNERVRLKTLTGQAIELSVIWKISALGNSPNCHVHDETLGNDFLKVLSKMFRTCNSACITYIDSFYKFMYRLESLLYVISVN